MPDFERQPFGIPTVETVISGIANWVGNYRYSLGLHNQLGQCGPDEVMRVAKDLGLTPSALSELASRGPGAADLLQKMLVALHVDPNVLANTDPQIMRDLQRLCVTCGEKNRCIHELATGMARENLREFCPNAFTLDVLFGLTDQPSPDTWEPISKVPMDCDLELAVIDREGSQALMFPCRRIADGWIKAKTKERIDVHPSHWRRWRQPS